MPATIDFLPEFQRCRLAEFRARLRAGRAAVLIGAGVSFRAGQPDGRALAQSLSKGQGLLPEIGDDLIATCDVLETRHGRAWLNRELARLLDDERLPLSDAHQLLARTEYAAYYTTNVDRLMEWALMDSGRPYSTVFLDPDAALMGIDKTPVVKLHGTIDHPHTMVFTSGDFDGFSGLMKKLMFGAAAFDALLVVGYRGADPNFRRILKLVGERYGGAMPLLIDFGREAEREELLKAGMFLVDPGAGQYDRLADILAWLGDLDDDVVEVCRRRHQRVFRANPFPGLAPYGLGGRDFYGRDRQIQALADRLPSLAPVTVFFGDSGCGKTSFFQAGLLPELERRGQPWALVAVDPGSDPAQRLEEAVRAKLGEGHSAGLASCLSPLTRQAMHLTIVVDQFERVLIPEPTAQAERFLARTLPDLARRFGTVLRLLIVLRSDALHYLHPYRHRPGLEGVYSEAERMETLGRAETGYLVRSTFLGKDYRLPAKAVGALVTQAAAGPDKTYLPYLQLLCRTLFGHLDAQYGGRRGIGGPIEVRTRDLRTLGSANVILAHVRDAALALVRIEPDRATVFKLFDLLTERRRRAILRRDRLRHEFADVGRVNLLLHELANRRLVHFEEQIEGHELVHDSLVEPMREFLDQHRVDFSHGDLLGLARRAFAGEVLTPGAVTNLALFCLRRGISPAWLEETLIPVGGWLRFWIEARLICHPEERVGVWERIALWADRSKSPPPDLTAVEILSQLLPARDQRFALVLVRVLARMRLTPEDVETVHRWIDPDRSEEGAEEIPDAVLLTRIGLPGEHIAALDTLPLRRGWADVIGVVVAEVLTPRRVDPCRLFTGYQALMYSETDWWRFYIGHLLTLTDNPKRKTRIGDRLRGLMDQAGDDPELLNGMADALAAAPAVVKDWPDVVQRVIDGLAKRSRRQPNDRLLQLSEQLVETSPKYVLLRLLPLFADFVRSGSARRAARLLALAAQEEEDLRALLDRAAKISDPEAASWFHHAALESPAEISGAEARYRGYPYDTIIDVHRPDWLSETVKFILSDDWQVAGCALFERWPSHELPLRVHALMLLPETVKGEDLWLLWSRLWRLPCAATLHHAAALGVEVPDGAPCVDDWPTVALLWDQLYEALSDPAADLSKAADALHGQLRWLRHTLPRGSDTHPIAVWLNSLEDLPHLLRGTWPSTNRFQASYSIDFTALWTSAENPVAPECDTYKLSGPNMLDGFRRALESADALNGPRNGALIDALRRYRRAEDFVMVRMAFTVSEELLLHAIPHLPRVAPDESVPFLWAVLDRSAWIGLPGVPEYEVSNRAIDALIEIYAEAPDALLESLDGAIKEISWKLRALVRIARRHPRAATERLAAAIESVVEEGDQPPELGEAFDLLAKGDSSPDIVAVLRRLLTAGLDEAAELAAARALLRLSPEAADRLPVLERALLRPELAQAWEREA